MLRSRSLLLFCVFLALPLPAKAALLFCNRAQAPIEAAFGYRDQNLWLSEGWWQIQPGQCARITGKPLDQRYYFYYGRTLTTQQSSKQLPVWSGKYAFCTDNKAFRIEGDGNCEARGYKERGFQEIDIGPNRRDYTLTFNDGRDTK